MPSEKLCARALELYEAELSANPAVQGLGIVAAEGEAADSDNVVVAVYVEKMPAEGEPALERSIPESLEVPEGGAVRRVAIRVIAQGPVRLEGAESAEIGLEIAPETVAPEAAEEE